MKKSEIQGLQPMTAAEFTTAVAEQQQFIPRLALIQPGTYTPPQQRGAAIVREPLTRLRSITCPILATMALRVTTLQWLSLRMRN